MRQRIDETRDFVRETFGIPSKGTMKNQNGLDEFDLAAMQEGNASYRLHQITPLKKRRYKRTNVRSTI